MPSASELSQSVCDRLRAFRDPVAYNYVIGATTYTVAWQTPNLHRIADRIERNGDTVGATELRKVANALAGMFHTAMDTLDRLTDCDAEDAAADDNAEAAA